MRETEDSSHGCGWGWGRALVLYPETPFRHNQDWSKLAPVPDRVGGTWKGAQRQKANLDLDIHRSKERREQALSTASVYRPLSRSRRCSLHPTLHLALGIALEQLKTPWPPRPGKYAVCLPDFGSL